MATRLELDPRWQWFDVTALGDHETRYVKGPCNHLETVLVESMVTGDTLAQLCLTCDGQLDAGKSPETDQMDALISAYEHASNPDVKRKIRQRLSDLTDGWS